MRHSLFAAKPTAVCLFAVWALSGCQPGPKPTYSEPLRSGGSEGGLIKSVAGNINRLEDFDSNEMTQQVCDQLNQWVLNDHPTVDWRRDPLLDKLPAEFRGLPEVKQIDATIYTLGDVAFLQESIWVRDIAQQARAGAFDDLETAERLFDWTVRNLQLRADSGDVAKQPFHAPREALLTSQATAPERAWLFVLLARQCGLDAVALALPQDGDRPPRFWTAALIQGQEFYLFDPWLGFAIPGPAGKGVATLSQVIADPGLLRALDLDEKRRYPVEAAEIHDIVPWLEASPQYLSKRMKLVESRLAGSDKVTLTVDASALASRVPQPAALVAPQVWPLPYEALLQRSRIEVVQEPFKVLAAEILPYRVQPQLASARALEFKGVWDVARKKFMSARPSELDLLEQKWPPEQRALIDAAKQLATFSLGQMAFEERDYAVAVDFFLKRMLHEAPDGILSRAAQYNLARSYEALGEDSKAIELYNDDDSPQRYGNRVRARRLQQTAAKTPPPTGASPAPSP